jgi:hypothetical protein
MLYFDIAMPITLLVVVTIAMLLNQRTEKKLKSTVEGREFKTRDVVFLIVFMAILVSVLAYGAMVNPDALFENALLVFFLSAYTTLLFTISFVFSAVTKTRAQLLSAGFGSASILAGLICLSPQLRDSFAPIRLAAFFGLAIFCFSVVVYEQYKNIKKSRWYLAVQPAATFLLLFVFLNVINNTGTAAVWFPAVMDVFGLSFAILIILYLSSLFSWKTVGFFAVLLTTMDIILVFTGPMVAAATAFTGLGLPVLVYLPHIPLIHYTGPTNIFGYAPVGLGLGDFFFAGVLAVQTLKKFGLKTAFASVVAMTVAFGLWEASFIVVLPAISGVIGHELAGFPGTLMIVTGWAPIILVKLLLERGKTPPPPAINQPQEASPQNENMPIK